MRDMRCVNNYGCYSLSKGTQSDGLISDTSTEGFTSCSSTENLKECESIEQDVAKDIEEIRNESQNSPNSLHSKLSTSLHQMQSQCRLYIRWGVLLSFGILLWVALWLTDIFNPDPFLKEDVASAKKVTLKAGVGKKPVPSAWWFFNLWSYTYKSISSVTTMEIIVVLCCIIILVYHEAHIRSKWGGIIGRLWYDQLYENLLNTGAEQSKTASGSLHFKILDQVLTPKEPEIESSSDSLSKFSYGDVRNLTAQEAKIKPKLGEKCTKYSNQEQSSIKNNISKSLKGSHNINNTRKRSFQANVGKNYCNFSRRSNNQSQDVVTRELVLNKPNFDSSCRSSTSDNDKTKLIPEQTNLTCSIFNKSTSIVSEEIETWFELPNSAQAENVMHSFDMELEEFFRTRSNSSLLSYGPTTDLQQFNRSTIGCDCGKQSEAVTLNDNYNGGIISSSPAFQRFLVNLARDRLSEPYS